MGTDIHGGFIKLNKDGTKQPIKTNWEMDRDYTLFAILAGVRNGYGFAGCYRHEPVAPIAEGRGLPAWLSVCEDDNESPDVYNKWEKDTLGDWIGDHSYTYMTLDEILSWEGWKEHILRGGVVDIDHYKETVATKVEPKHWCGDIVGDRIKIHQWDNKNPTIPEDATHVRCQWVSARTLGEDYSWFLDEIKRIKEEHSSEDSEIYLVVGFDS